MARVFIEWRSTKEHNKERTNLKKGIFSNIIVILASISLAVAPLFANTATVFSGENIADQSK